jgi:ribosomal protein S1
MEVDVKITDIDNDKHKVSLSIRALLAPEPAPGTVLDNTHEIVYDTDAPHDFDSDKTDEAAE